MDLFTEDGGFVSFCLLQEKTQHALDMENARKACVLLILSTQIQMENCLLLSTLNIFLIRLCVASFCQNDDKEDLFRQQLSLHFFWIIKMLN